MSFYLGIVFRLFLLHLYSRLFDRWDGVFGFCTSGFQDAFRGTSEMIADRRTPVDCVLDRYPPTCLFTLACSLIGLFACLFACSLVRSLCLFCFARQLGELYIERCVPHVLERHATTCFHESRHSSSILFLSPFLSSFDRIPVPFLVPLRQSRRRDFLPSSRHSIEFLVFVSDRCGES